MRQLNNALNDALAGFDEDEDDDVMKDEEEENGQDLIIDESPRNKRKGAYSRSSPIKLKLNVAKSDAKIKTSSRLEDLKMTKAHQVSSNQIDHWGLLVNQTLWLECANLFLLCSIEKYLETKSIAGTLMDL